MSEISVERALAKFWTSTGGGDSEPKPEKKPIALLYGKSCPFPFPASESFLDIQFVRLYKDMDHPAYYLYADGSTSPVDVEIEVH